MIGGEGAALWQSVSKSVSVVDVIGKAGNIGDFGSNLGGTSTTIKRTVLGKLGGKLGLGGVLGGGSGGGSIPADDKACKSQGVTNEGVISSARWRALINGGVLAVNTANSLKMAKLQRDIGKAYLALAEEQRNYYNNRYKPLEISLVKEAMELKKYKRDKEPMTRGQMLVSARYLNAGKLDAAMACTGRYCTGQRAAMMNDQLLEQAAVESLTAGLAHRYTDKEEMAYNNLRWDKREQVLKLGRDIPTQAVSYASMAAGIFGSLGRQAGQVAEGAMGFLAYGRADTQYPQRRQPITYPAYYFEPTKLELPKVERPKVFEAPKAPETTIKLSG